ncbi:DUF3419 family protein [Pontivivens ytuae]|uniref:BtaA family protein n=1 Tax=Pontivivens ytuae TaxID=2789856 RepID=A0A7S9QDY3_9RHOB|nr:DUF3419 family protein [Pontivivens ytuae]QPH55370.1 BtaA family protein [Pontivivens ytuae]
MTIQTADMDATRAAAVHQNAALSREGLLERVFSRLFRGLVYAQIWEDPVADMAALDLTRGDDMVCIASGGCNVMSYLTAEPRSITAVDLSAAHVALLRLKLAGARHLPDFDTFYRFFGHADRAANVRTYDEELAPRLDTEARAYWEGRSLRGRNINMFANNFYAYGLLGRTLWFAHLLARLGGADLRRVLSAKTLEDQREVFEAEVAPLFEKRAVRWLGRRRASLFGLGIPPAQYDKLAADGDGNVMPVLRERVRRLMCDFPIAENYFAWAAFNRGYKREEPRSVPPYLEREAFGTVRKGAAHVQVHNRSLTDLLAEQPAESKSVYVLLDAQDWMTDAQLTALWSEITRTARPGARVIFRTGGAADILPGRVDPAVLGQWHYDAEASAAAFRADRSAIYGGVHLYRLGAKV